MCALNVISLLNNIWNNLSTLETRDTNIKLNNIDNIKNKNDNIYKNNNDIRMNDIRKYEDSNSLSPLYFSDNFLCCWS